MKSSQEKKLKDLVDKINYHNDLYYNKDKLLDNGDRWESVLAKNLKTEKIYK